MTLSRTAGGLAVFAVLLSGCSDDGRPSASVVAAPAATLSPQPLPPAAAERLPSPVPEGAVTLRPGPFDDRFALAGTSLDDGTVTTSLTVTSDVSDLIVLEAVVDFYRADGRLLGSVRRSHAPDHGGAEGGEPEEAVALEVEADEAYRDDVASAVLSVPVLVNE